MITHQHHFVPLHLNHPIRQLTPNSMEALKRLGYTLTDIFDLKGNQKKKPNIPKEMKSHQNLYLQKRNEYQFQKKLQRYQIFLEERQKVIYERMQPMKDNLSSMSLNSSKNNQSLIITKTLIKHSNRQKQLDEQLNNNMSVESNKKNVDDDEDIFDEYPICHYRSQKKELKSIENIILKKLLEEQVKHNQVINKRAQQYRNECIINKRKQKVKKINDQKIKMQIIKKQKQFKIQEEYQKLNRFNIRKMQNRILKMRKQTPPKIQQPHKTQQKIQPNQPQQQQKDLFLQKSKSSVTIPKYSQNLYGKILPEFTKIQNQNIKMYNYWLLDTLKDFMIKKNLAKLNDCQLQDMEIIITNLSHQYQQFNQNQMLSSIY